MNSKETPFEPSRPDISRNGAGNWAVELSIQVTSSRGQIPFISFMFNELNDL